MHSGIQMHSETRMHSLTEGQQGTTKQQSTLNTPGMMKVQNITGIHDKTEGQSLAHLQNPEELSGRAQSETGAPNTLKKKTMMGVQSNKLMQRAEELQSGASEKNLSTTLQHKFGHLDSGGESLPANYTYLQAARRLSTSGCPYRQDCNPEIEENESYSQCDGHLSYPPITLTHSFTRTPSPVCQTSEKIQVTLSNHHLWSKFHKHHTEMIITKQGR